MNTSTLWLVIVALCVGTGSAAADNKDAAPPRVKYQVIGLFAPEREQDLREAFAKIPQIKLVDIDFKNAEVTLEYDAAKVFPNTKPEEMLPNLDALLKTASTHTFGVKPLRTTPREKLKLVEIQIGILDCKACGLAAYECVAKLDGVDRATVNYREGHVTALIDPDKTDRGKLEAALPKLGAQVKAP